jgi:hypothetical protein
MDSNTIPTISLGGQTLIDDIADNCIVYPGKNGVPTIVMPLPGNPMPRTRGQVEDAVVDEFRRLGLKLTRS